MRFAPEDPEDPEGTGDLEREKKGIMMAALQEFKVLCKRKEEYGIAKQGNSRAKERKRREKYLDGKNLMDTS